MCVHIQNRNAAFHFKVLHTLLIHMFVVLVGFRWPFHYFSWEVSGLCTHCNSIYKVHWTSIRKKKFFFVQIEWVFCMSDGRPIYLGHFTVLLQTLLAFPLILILKFYARKISYRTWCTETRLCIDGSERHMLHIYGVGIYNLAFTQSINPNSTM